MVLDRIRDFLTGRARLPVALENALKKYGKETIKNVLVCRKPVQSGIRALLNIATKGELDKKLRENKYEDLYHLKMYLVLTSGVRMLIEKNERINFMVNPPDEDDDCRVVERVVNIPFNQFIERAIKRVGIRDFITYNARTLNCQQFIMNLLISNNISSPSLTKFVLQDADDLVFKEYPQLEKIAKVITDVAGGVGEAIEVAKEVKKTPIGQVVSKLVEPFAPFFSAVNKSFSGVFEPTKKTPEHRAVSTPPEPEVETVERMDETPMVD